MNRLRKAPPALVVRKNEDKRSVSIYQVIAVAIGLGVLAAYLTFVGRKYGLDLWVYRDGIATWRAGIDPYLRLFTVHKLGYTYPPPSLAYLALLDTMSFSVSQIVLWTASLIAIVIAVYVVRVDVASLARLTPSTAAESVAVACLSVLVLEPVRSGFDYGQIDAVLMVLVVLDAFVMPRRYRGYLIGVAMAIKLTPAIFLIYLLVDRDVKACVRAIAVFVGSVVIMGLIWPSLSFQYWWRTAWHPSRVGSLSFQGNQSWFGVLERLPIGGWERAGLWLLLSSVTVVVAVVGAVISRRRGCRSLPLVMLAIAGLLVSPVSWTHHWVWLILIVPIVVDRKHRPRTVVSVALLALLCIGVAGPYWWWASGVQSGVASAVLPLTAGAVLVIWATTELKDRRPAMALNPVAVGAGSTVGPEG